MDKPLDRIPKAEGLSPRMIILLTTTSFLVITTVIIAVVFLQPQEIRVGSGVPGGTLAEITPPVVKVLDQNTERLRFKFADSYGTRENVAALKRGDIDIAIIYEGITPRGQIESPIRTFARLYANPLHVIASEASGIVRFEDINRRHRLAIPPSGVASHKRARDVLELYGIYTATGYKLIETDDFYSAAHLLKTGRVDLAFFGGAIPIPAINNYFQEDATRFRFVTLLAAEAIVVRKPQYETFSIPARSYMGSPPFPREDISTIASIASLVGRTDLEERVGEDSIYKMTEALFNNRSYLVSRFPYLHKMSQNWSPQEPEYPLYEGSTNYYLRDEPIVWDKVTLYVSSFFSVIFLVLTIINYTASRRSRR